MTPEGERHVVVAAALVDHRGVLLCHRRPDRRWYPDVWDLPGGHVGPDETARAAVDRECREELGVRLLEATGVPVSTGDPLVELTLFTVRAWVGVPTNTAPREHDRIAWFTRADLDTVRLASDRYRPLLARAMEPTR
jgi:8-oxo-dGTP diphosphatase